MRRFQAFSIALTFTITCLLPNRILNSPTSNRIVTKLIYHNAVGSPSFDQTAKLEDRVDRDMEISLARLNFLPMQGQGFTDQNDFQASIVSRRAVSLFLVRFEMGEPPVQQTVAFDTGSSLFWVHCDNPVGGQYSLDPPYNSAESSTFSNLADCHEYCTGAAKKFCDDQSCEYSMQYGTGYSRGILASERFIFKSSHSKGSVINNVVFGCSHVAKTAADNYNGLLGLGTAKHSLLSQLGSDEFSYCIGKIGDSSYDENILIVGKNLATGGDSTPLQIDGFKYYADLEGISFGGKMLDIDKEQLKRSNHKGGTAFDSGSSFSILHPVAYWKLHKEIVDLVGDSLERVDYHGTYVTKLCYKGNLYTDFIGFPTVALHFANDATMELDYENIFQQYASKVCLNVVDASQLGYKFSLIGVNFQQYFYMAFDLKAKQLTFQRMDCSALWTD